MELDEATENLMFDAAEGLDGIRDHLLDLLDGWRRSAASPEAIRFLAQINDELSLWSARLVGGATDGMITPIVMRQRESPGPAFRLHCPP